MQIGEMLMRLRKEKGLTQAQVADYCKKHGKAVTQKGVSKWEQGATDPGVEQFLLLCRLYDVSDVLAVFGGGAASLNDLGRQRLIEYMRLLQSCDNYVQTSARRHVTRRIPLYDLPVSAGTGQFLDSDHYELIEVDESVPLDATIAARVFGDSMEPRFASGSIIYIKPQPRLEKGELGVFLHNGSAFFKQLGGDTKPELISLNKSYAPVVVNEFDELRVIGKVLV